MKSFLGVLACASALAISGVAAAAPDLTPEIYGRSDYLGGNTYNAGSELLISFKVMNLASATNDAPGTLSSGSAGWMADVILSTDNVGPTGFAIYSPAWREDVLLRGGRMSRTNTLTPSGEQMFNGPTVMRGGPPARPYDYLTFPMPTGVRPGAYHICIVADPANVVAESNERNNTACMPITIRARLRAPRIEVRPEQLPQPSPR